MKAEQIFVLLKECLNRLNETDADVVFLTCNQGISNQSAYTALDIYA